MSVFVSWIAPRTTRDFAMKMIIVLVVGNLLAMAVVFAIHGHFPSGLTGQIVETTIIAVPFAWGFLKIIAYLYQLQSQLAELATTDVLTGLGNRRAFLDRVAAMQAGGRDGHLFLADADHFKQINDRFGHEAGDACLQAIARHLAALSQPQDVLARIGGEEFAVFRPSPSRPAPEAFGRAICEEIVVAYEGLPGPEQGLRVSLSAGAVPAPHDVPLRALLAEADKLLYRAKVAGRKRCMMGSLTGPEPVLGTVA